MAKQLLELGYLVTGTDASESMLARARTLLGPECELIHAILPDTGTAAMFDAAISNFDGLNYLTPEAFAQSLQAIAAQVRNGGWLCFDLHTDAMLDFTMKNSVISGQDEGFHFNIRSVVEPDARTCDTWIDVKDTRDGALFTEHHRQYFHSDEAVVRALESAGFASITIVDEYTHAPANADTLRATWLSRRQANGVPA
jgi:SAM-dependent methyltransferase